jgi:hypothetical protein
MPQAPLIERKDIVSALSLIAKEIANDLRVFCHYHLFHGARIDFGNEHRRSNF